MASEEPNNSSPSPNNLSPAPENTAEAPAAYRTKHVEFLGRSTPIILQNDNGPCPLLAICNVLLLRNSLDFGPESPEVPLNRLLSVLAEKLIDSNSHIQSKDDGYAINQQQNIGDAIDLLPRLATGIDVNVQFRKINDFEFTRECAIFDLLDIGLYHGWIVDPQDTETAAAIGSKSYNTLVGELVSFDTSRMDGENTSTVEEDSVDFAAATTAALGVPSPSLSRVRSFDIHLSPESPDLARQGSKRGDREEEEELMRALDMSKADISVPVTLTVSPDANPSHILDEGSHIESSISENNPIESSISENNPDTMVIQNGFETENLEQPDLIAPKACNEPSALKDDSPYSQVPLVETNTLPTITVNKMEKPASQRLDELAASDDTLETVKVDLLMPNSDQPVHSTDGDKADEDPAFGGNSKNVSQLCTEDSILRPGDNQTGLTDDASAVSSGPVSQATNIESSNGRVELPDVSELPSSSLDGTEPIYEGEEHIGDSSHSKFEDREPIYEGEVVLAEQSNKMVDDSSSLKSIYSQKEYHLIKNFLGNSASQLTIYGLFCLQEGLKERELCVFFRNNHFSTMFKYNGELYLLATDQGYINQTDLVWEKLNEVNGDTVFMTGNFTEFKIDNQANDSWNEQSAVTSTADYLAKLEGSEPATSSYNTDLQLAIALQQQEFDHQQERPQQQSSQPQQQSTVSGRSRLVTGPQVPRSSRAPQRSESKSAKEKNCAIM